MNKRSSKKTKRRERYKARMGKRDAPHSGTGSVYHRKTVVIDGWKFHSRSDVVIATRGPEPENGQSVQGHYFEAYGFRLYFFDDEGLSKLDKDHAAFIWGQYLKAKAEKMKLL